VTVLAVSTAQADVIHVDASCPGGDGSVGDPYCSIQTAIDNAVDTDEIVVAPGTYFETINFQGKAIRLRSSHGPEVTTIDAQGVGNVVKCNSGEGPDTTIEGFAISGGVAPIGAGMSNTGTSPTVMNCIFQGNDAVTGAGMFNYQSNPLVINCIFRQNTAGGLLCNEGALSDDCCVPHDTPGCNDPACEALVCAIDPFCCDVEWDVICADEASSICGICGCGQGEEGGGGMMNDSGSQPTVINCVFVDNFGQYYGGGMANFTSDPLVSNCTFIANTSPVGGGIYNSSSNPGILNSILWGNGGEIANTGSSPGVSYSNVEGGYSGVGNIDADPMFVDPDNGDYRLSAGSPCIDTGDNSTVPKGVLRDLDGNPRFVADACAGAAGATVDMGSYEFQGTSCDLSNIMAMLASWGYCGNCRRCRYDFDGDCSVGILDLLILLRNRG
jgi:hypothetical protein